MLRVLACALVVCGICAAVALSASSGSLKVTYYAHGIDNGAQVWSLSCAPAVGTHPFAGRSCVQLNYHPADLAPATRACPLMSPVNGPQARITGTWHGSKVDRIYRAGCPGWNDLHLVLTGQ